MQLAFREWSLGRATNALLAALAILAPIANNAALAQSATSRSSSSTPVVLPWVFTDHMVLQRGGPLPIWGTAGPGERIEVTFGERKQACQADARGAFRVELPAMAASATGRDLIVRSQTGAARCRDVLVGEVWLCAGQSNMDFPLRRATGGKTAASAQGPLLRLCNRTGSPSGDARRLNRADLANMAQANEGTQSDYYSGSWQAASAASAAEFSAVGFFFGVDLAKQLDVPIGLIDVSIGGSSTEGWVPREVLHLDPTLAPLADDFLATHLSHAFIRERTATHLAEWLEAGQPKPRPRHFFTPGFLYNEAIRTLAPFAIAGVAWYQGESNAHLPRIADRLFRLMVPTWRRAWARPKLPFYYVQLPAMGRKTWPEFREVQASWLDIAHTGMAVAIDTGHPTDVHPRDKRPIAQRLARLALANTYGRDIAWRGPVPESVHQRGERLEIAFESAHGLAPGTAPEVSAFEVCGADRRFYPATATIEANSVLLASREVDRPIDARYAWAPVPMCGLFDQQGLPAAPFRTHSWRPVRIACIGDSITEGHGLAKPAIEAYPARLQQLLGDGYHVENFGHSGTGVVLATLRGKWARAFRRNPEHQDAMCFEPDVVISNLGINDIMSWPTGKLAFGADYKALIDDYRALPSNPKILLWSPLAPLFPGQKFYQSPYEPQISAAISRVAQQVKCKTIDLHTPLREHGELFPDHIHPDAQGASRIAEAVCTALRLQGILK